MTRIRRAFLSAIALASSLSACAQGPGLGQVSEEPHRFQTWKDRLYENMVRQRTDFNCGAASLATISNFYFARPIPEEQFLDAIRATYTPEAWKERERDGLTMLDLRHAAQHLGFAAQGVRMTLEALASLRGPVIVHLDKKVIQHFSVLRGIRDGRAYLADPISGNIRVSLYRFAEQWTRYALLVWEPDRPLPAEYALALGSRDADTESAAVRSALYPQPHPPRWSGLP